jgi:putative serine protease PepD
MFASLALVGNPDTEKGGHGSGFFIKQNQVITAKHVGSLLTYSDSVYDFMGRPYAIERVDISENEDIALITLKDNARPEVIPATLDCELPAVLEPVVALGHPLNMKAIMAIGHVNGTEVVKPGPDLSGGFRVVTSVAAGPGMSGGPVFNQAGRVFGIITAVALAQRSQEDLFNVGFTYTLPFKSTPELCKRTLPDEGKPK